MAATPAAAELVYGGALKGSALIFPTPTWKRRECMRRSGSTDSGSNASTTSGECNGRGVCDDAGACSGQDGYSGVDCPTVASSSPETVLVAVTVPIAMLLLLLILAAIYERRREVRRIARLLLDVDQGRAQWVHKSSRGQSRGQSRGGLMKLEPLNHTDEGVDI